MWATSKELDRAEGATLDRVLTVPNLISIGRVGLLGIFVWLLFGPDRRIFATVVLMVVGITDFLDGYLARRFHQVSTLGKVLDPLADRLVLATGVIAIVVYGAAPVWLAIVVLAREVLVSVAVLLLAAKGAPRIDVLWVGKAGTFGLMCCFPLFLLGDAPSTWAHVLTTVTWIAVVPSLAFSFVAAAAYVPLARQALGRRRVAAGAKEVSRP